ncbi:hypothetical protein P8452_44770 [Trifolium repens]|jgi:hypothetical protein|nr:hypothetical protein P8452_44770 [Trifolium repens]
MDCQSQIPLGPLSNDEAWALLKKHSGIEDESSSDILNVAHQIVFECEMLPGTIKAGYLSTIESIVFTLKAVGENHKGLDNLLDTFESMFDDQRRCKDERLSKVFPS